VEDKPHYARTTATMLSKDRELGRIVDQDEMKAKIIFTLTHHKEAVKQDYKHMNISRMINE
jgi:hypothetical protein